MVFKAKNIFIVCIVYTKYTLKAIYMYAYAPIFRSIYLYFLVCCVGCRRRNATEEIPLY